MQRCSPFTSHFLTPPVSHWSTPSSRRPSLLGRSSESHRRWWSRRGCHRRRAFWLNGGGRELWGVRWGTPAAWQYYCISWGRKTWGMCILWQLTVRHKLHSCDHGAAEMNGAQRVVALTNREEDWVQSVGENKIVATNIKKKKRKQDGLSSRWLIIASTYLCGIIIMHISRVVPQCELAHLPVFSPVSLQQQTFYQVFNLTF